MARGALARIGAGAAVVVCVLALVGPIAAGQTNAGFEGLLPPTGHPLSAAGRGHKEASLALRFGAWKGSVQLLADRPFGVGAGHFEHAFIPYQLATSASPSEALWFRSPHNELLRLAIEEGLPVAAVLVLVFVSLVLRAWRARGTAHGLPWLLGGGALLASQCLFQFPLETACGVLFAALWLALLLDATAEPPAPSPAGSRWALARRRLLTLAVLIGVAAGSLALHRSARANALLGDGRGQRLPTREACALEPHNVAACVTAAWLESAQGHPSEAERLTLDILRFSPHYFPAIKLLGELRLARGERDSGCQDLALYERLFETRGLASPILDTHCPRDARPRSRARVPSLFWSSYPGLPWQPGVGGLR